MGRSIAIRAGWVAVVVALLVVGAAAPVVAGKGPRKQVGTPAAPPGQSSKAAPTAKGSPPVHARTNSKPVRSKPGNATPSKGKPANEGKGKGRGPARGHDKRRPATKAASRVARPDRAGTHVLGLRMAGGPADETVAASGPALFPRPSGEALPFTGGDIAAMLFIGMMVITIGGLIWRAPSLIDKPRRSRDLSI